MIKVYILDDHPIVRKGLGDILKSAPGIELSGEASTSGELMELLKKDTPDVLVLDITMPDDDGLEVLKDMRLSHPEVNVLMLSVHPEDQLAVRCLRSGAMGYLSKERISEEVVSAIKKVAIGKRYITDAVAERLAIEIDGPSSGLPHESLSDREIQILRLISQGMKVSEIGDRLMISSSTVRTYRERILKKMNMRNDSELTYYALKNGLIE
jgi:two-component system invasion response regulator UvrY